MVAVFYRYGRLGNRLFTFSNLVAFSQMKNVPLMVPAFSEYRKDFPFFADDAACRYAPEGTKSGAESPLVISLMARAGLIPTVRFWEPRHVYFDAEDADDRRVQTLLHCPRVVFEGWNFRSRKAIFESRETIRKVFRPSESIAARAAARASAANNSADAAVGVHVRWGDYRGSERYFEKHEYARRMEELRSLLAPAKVSFLLFSSEQPDLEGFPANTVLASTSSAVQDLFSLAACDYIVGPPSTFSMWASYYGGKPLFTMDPGKCFDDLSIGFMATP